VVFSPFASTPALRGTKDGAYGRTRTGLGGPADDRHYGELAVSKAALRNEYLRLENWILKGKVSGRIRFTEEERRPLTRMSRSRGTALRALWGTDEFLDSTG